MAMKEINKVGVSCVDYLRDNDPFERDLETVQQAILFHPVNTNCTSFPKKYLWLAYKLSHILTYPTAVNKVP